MPLPDEDSSEVWPAELQDDLGFVMELDFEIEDQKDPYIEVLSPPPEPENQS